MKILSELHDNKNTVNIHLDKDEKINKFNYGTISTGSYSTLSRVAQMQFDDKRILVYHISSEKNLEMWLSEKHSEFDFTSVLSSIIKTFIDISEGGLPLENILLDPKYVFINEKNKNVEFIFIPIIEYKTAVSLYSFISDVIKKVDFLPEESPDYLNDLISFTLKNEFSLKKLREKIDENCGKLIREDHKIVFDNGNNNSKKKIKKNGDVFLRDISDIDDVLPLKKKVKTEPGKTGIKKTKPEVEYFDRSVEKHYKVSKEHKKNDSLKEDNGNEDFCTPDGFAIPMSSSSKKSKSKKDKSKKSFKNRDKNFEAPQLDESNQINIPDSGFPSKDSNKKSNKQKSHSFNLTEMLIDYIKKSKEKNDSSGKKNKKKSEKKSKSITSDFDIPNDIQTSNRIMDKPVYDKNNSEDLKNNNEIEKSQEVLRLDAERKRLEKEKSEHEQAKKKKEEEKRIEYERQKALKEAAERELFEKKKAEEDRLEIERKKIADEREKQNKEAIKLSEERKKLEAERQKFEKENAERDDLLRRTEEEKKIVAERNQNLDEKQKEKNYAVHKNEYKDYEQLPQNNAKSGDDSEPTLFLSNKSYAASLYPKLIRKKTNETVYISKSAYRIGKEKSNVDYRISNNSAISRLHAIIYCKEGRYYIVDTLSTNHTFVNGKIITSNQNYELLSGDIITLADEDFDFIIQ